eukprot:6044137-Amphidinium_carterae.1
MGVFSQRVYTIKALWIKGFVFTILKGCSIPLWDISSSRGLRSTKGSCEGGLLMTGSSMALSCTRQL